MIVFGIVLYVIGIFGTFFLMNLILGQSDDDVQVAICLSLVWPVSLTLVIVTAAFVLLKEASDKLRTKIRSKTKSMGGKRQ